jgi:[ribosomal protein S18]-alanine N-acetyltransferase
LNIELRPGDAGDLASIAQIQTASPEASQWDVREYLRYELLVAVCGGRVAGFAVARRLAEGESELLNLAVDPAFRRRGIGRRLVAALTSGHPGTSGWKCGSPTSAGP